MEIPSEYYETRTIAGHPVRIYSTLAGGSQPVHGAYSVGPENEQGQYVFEWIPTAWCMDGRRFSDMRHPLDLIESFLTQEAA